jgi:hypothetical protein
VRDENRRSLGYARDDKKERAVVEKERLLKERLIVRARETFSFATARSKATVLSLGNRSFSTTALSFLSSRA